MEGPVAARRFVREGRSPLEYLPLLVHMQCNRALKEASTVPLDSILVQPGSLPSPQALQVARTLRALECYQRSNLTVSTARSIQQTMKESLAHSLQRTCSLRAQWLGQGAFQALEGGNARLGNRLMTELSSSPARGSLGPTLDVQFRFALLLSRLDSVPQRLTRGARVSLPAQSLQSPCSLLCEMFDVYEEWQTGVGGQPLSSSQLIDHAKETISPQVSCLLSLAASMTAHSDSIAAMVIFCFELFFPKFVLITCP